MPPDMSSEIIITSHIISGNRDVTSDLLSAADDTIDNAVDVIYLNVKVTEAIKNSDPRSLQRLLQNPVNSQLKTPHAPCISYREIKDTYCQMQHFRKYPEIHEVLTSFEQLAKMNDTFIHQALNLGYLENSVIPNRGSEDLVGQKSQAANQLLGVTMIAWVQAVSTDPSNKVRALEEFKDKTLAQIKIARPILSLHQSQLGCAAHRFFSCPTQSERCLDQLERCIKKMDKDPSQQSTQTTDGIELAPCPHV